MSREANRAFDNLILLCERHASEIDITPEHYPAEVLREWKQVQVEAHSKARHLALTDAEAAEVAEASFTSDDLIERLTAVLPFSARSRSRAEALVLASKGCLARSKVRLRSTPADRVEAALAWKARQATPEVEVPQGALRVLVAPMGAGKSEKAEQWWSEGLTAAWRDADVEIPVWLEARDIPATLTSALQNAMGGDPLRECRVVVDNLDAVSPQQADRLLDEARRLVLTWPLVSVLATTRPGAGTVDEGERIDVEPWSPERGLDLLRAVTDEYHFRTLEVYEVQQLLTSPLQVHALATWLRAGRDGRVSTHELLSGLAASILQRERPRASPQVWESLPRLAACVLDADGAVAADSFARRHVIWELEETGLVVHDRGLLRFALPLFEQHFAAQALQDGHTSIESAAGPDQFPRWRYALAFAVEGATYEVVEELILRMARTNPAAASWVLEEAEDQTTRRAHLQSPARRPAVRTNLTSGDDQEPAVVLGLRLREAMLAWLHGLGTLGPHLAPHHHGQLAPWGVRLATEEALIIGHARDGVLDEDVFLRGDLEFGTGQWRRHFHDISLFDRPRQDLARWKWTRDRLRDPLTRRLRQRTLPVPPASPLATERVWFLARLIMENRHGSRPARQIPLDDLRAEVDRLVAHAANTVRSTWQRGGSQPFDSDDVRWLESQLQHVHGDLLEAPRPAPDLTDGNPRYFWQTYSPQLTRSITADVLRDALIGYRELVETNFPRFGAALGLYGIFPVRGKGIVIMPRPDDTQSWSATVVFAVHRDASSGDRDTPAVDMGLAEDPDVPNDIWQQVRAVHSSVFRLPAVHQHQLSTGLERQATNLAYSWLVRDLKAVGWLDETINFYD
ncbi:hypothetical protein [Streptomyces sp. NPDC050564]|uniref:hypothetical protein n=1 Tax=Streptomyces sp. NPDC050564 TaxID=3365631 RepID=UPI0037AB5A2A